MQHTARERSAAQDNRGPTLYLPCRCSVFDGHCYLVLSADEGCEWRSVNGEVLRCERLRLRLQGGGLKSVQCPRHDGGLRTSSQKNLSCDRRRLMPKRESGCGLGSCRDGEIDVEGRKKLDEAAKVKANLLTSAGCQELDLIVM